MAKKRYLITLDEDVHRVFKSRASAAGMTIGDWLAHEIVERRVFRDPDPQHGTGGVVPEDVIPPARRRERQRQMSRVHVNEPPTTKPPAVVAPPPPKAPVIVEFHPAPKPASKK